MKKLSLLLLFVFGIFLSVSAQDAGKFITLWKPGVANPHNIEFPGAGTNYTIEWEEVGYPAHTGTIANVAANSYYIINLGNALNPTPANATYRIKISGDLTAFNASSVSYYFRSMLQEIQQWGKNPQDLLLHTSTEEKVEAFMKHLEKNRVNVRLRRSRGKDIDAACGQLANKGWC